MSLHDKKVIGWKEWVSLPGLNIPAIKTKVDSGARTSALHAFMLESFEENGVKRVRFGLHPIQRRTDIEVFGVADVVDHRIITNSGGQSELRYVIRTPVRMGDQEWPVEMTLTNRDSMIFRMLMGRQALEDRFLINPQASYLMGRIRSREVRALYKKDKK